MSGAIVFDDVLDVFVWTCSTCGRLHAQMDIAMIIIMRQRRYCIDSRDKVVDKSVHGAPSAIMIQITCPTCCLTVFSVSTLRHFLQQISQDKCASSSIHCPSPKNKYIWKSAASYHCGRVLSICQATHHWDTPHSEKTNE